jgi:histidyl-tRNA synthetase
MKYSLPTGVFDIIPENPRDPWKSSYLWNFVEENMRKIAHEYGYQEIRTPIFERAELFQRSVGDSSDIVTKEMYTFEDKGGRLLSLRPEGTAPAIRAVIEQQLCQACPIQKLFYIGPMFRYERPQTGRFRQHHQFGVEAIGNSSPEQDVEIIDLLYNLYHRLGLKNLTLYVNSLGDKESRQAYLESFKQYLAPFLSQLSLDSQKRFEMNPLRILDSKNLQDRKILEESPSILDFLSEEAREHFEHVQKILQMLKIPYHVNPALVRGLDYYNKTVFEIVAGELGAQNSIGGGGRYDGLIQDLGGPNLPSTGFGTGIERILHTMIQQNVALPAQNHPTIFLVGLGQAARLICMQLLHEFRQHGIPAEMDFSNRKMGKVLQYADQIGATNVIVIGEDELEKQQVEVKEMATGKLTSISLSDIVSTFITK